MKNEINETFGCIDTLDIRDYKLVADKIQLPVVFSLSMPEIKNQQSVSSCVAHALSTILEYYGQKEYNKTILLSTDYIYGNRTNSTHKDKGMIIRDALGCAKKYGDVFYSIVPLNTEVPSVIQKFEERDTSIDNDAKNFMIKSYFQLFDNESVKYNLYMNGPCICSVNWYKYDIKDDVLIFDKKSKQTGSHAMVIYGWNEKGWLIQNSWGKTWGNKGTCILPYDTKFNSIWGMIDDQSDLTLNIIQPNVFKRKWYALLNCLLFLGYAIKKMFARGG